MHHHFLIADRVVRVKDDSLAALMAGFECDSERTSALGSWNQEPICSIEKASAVPQHGVECLNLSHDVSHVLTLTRHGSAVLLADDLFENVTVRARRDEGLSDLLLLASYSRLAYYRTVFVHGALIDVPGIGGVMFIGRSGVGKTTQAELWKTHCGAEILNGDKVFLSVKEEYPNEIFAYGSPWNGSSPYRENKRVKLRAIVHLTRDAQYSIRHLSDPEALITYMPSVFLPNWDTRLTEAVMDTLDQMMPRVPIYCMSCGMDRSGIDMVGSVLTNG